LVIKYILLLLSSDVEIDLLRFGGKKREWKFVLEMLELVFFVSPGGYCHQKPALKTGGKLY